MLQIPELLAPAGDLERLRYAVCYGADAVYCALPEFGMRAAPANFTPEQLAEGVVYAHARGRKVYLTLNTLPTNEEAARMPDAIRLTDIAAIRDKTPPELELEAFVHGAMCMSVSGRCLLSNYLAGRDANRGQCAQPCRWKYYLSEETRPGQLYEIGEGEGGSYILNANDLCTAPFLDLLCKAGVDSLKIEGRAKTAEDFELDGRALDELTRTSHRPYSPGFYFGPEMARQNTSTAAYIREWEFVGTVDRWENGVAFCQQRGKWSLGDTLEALTPDGSAVPLHPDWIKNAAGEEVSSTPHAMETYTIPTPELPPMSLLRKKN